MMRENLTLNAVTGLNLNSSIRGLDLARAGGLQTYKIRHFVVRSFGLDSVLPTAGTITDGSPYRYPRY